jgi:glutaredoxin
MAKKYLSENNIAYEEVDVSSDQAAAATMVSKSGQMGVPVLDIDGEMVVGFDKPKIKQLLHLAQ